MTSSSGVPATTEPANCRKCGCRREPCIVCREASQCGDNLCDAHETSWEVTPPPANLGEVGSELAGASATTADEPRWCRNCGDPAVNEHDECATCAGTGGDGPYIHDPATTADDLFGDLNDPLLKAQAEIDNLRADVFMRDQVIEARDAELAQLKSMHDDAERRVDEQRDMLQRLRDNSDRICNWFWNNDPAALEDDGPTDAVLKKLDGQAAELATLREQTVPWVDVELWLTQRRDACQGLADPYAEIEGGAISDMLDDLQFRRKTGQRLPLPEGTS